MTKQTNPVARGDAGASFFQNLMQNISAQIIVLMDSIHNPVVGVDSRSRVVLCNQTFTKVVGRSRDEVIGTPIASIIPETRLTHIVNTGKTEAAKKIRIAGKLYLANRTPIINDGNVVGAMALLQDITGIEALGNELKHSSDTNEELQAIIESSFDGIFVTDGNGTVTRLNRAYERLTGIKRSEIMGKSMTELVSKGYYSESVTLKVLKSRQPESVFQEVKNGKTIMVTGTPVLDKEGQITRVVTNVRDVTQLNRLQHELCSMQTLRSHYEVEINSLRQEQGDGQYVIRSKKMLEIKALAMRIAQVDSTVLIQGESGVGKEMVAEMVHENGKRKGKPFIKINCASIPEALLEAELFGYTPGSFTGASKKGKAGLFEAADNGSIFMDEVGEMSLPLQSKLLRVIQEKEVTRIGDTRPITVNVRIIAATNRDLEKMVQEKTFRKDLFFRLNVVPIHIPPLRERAEAIVPMIQHFLAKYNKRFEFAKQIDREAVDILTAHPWPGNVRELENVIERLVVITPGELIGAADIPDSIRNPDGNGGLPSLTGKPLKELLEEVEARAITEALKTHGTTRKAAEALGINQSTVVRKASRYGLRP
ncbi:sigma 54-interacting transcriptional regulator [Desulfoluna butyratoxydans]|uniref:HTH-type transcriptional regulatory protein TyrR n=1 Tax=Desulfoluna butyratoxydans TaxID=231438 RepID=A0A4U8YXF9_9BACT|nr:sigma 54-interacting transcriptional regulator [Desulfoluna butyratoxydans]VFQ46742.1 pas fold [Desulfoluna butyratoxydans]